MILKTLLAISCIVALAGIHGLAQRTGAVIVHSSPKQILIERTRNGQELSFDFVLENTTSGNLELTNVRLTVFDETGSVVLQKSAWSGFDMTLPSTFLVEPKKAKLLFNPFYVFDTEVKLSRLKYEFSFNEVGENPKSFTTEVSVAPIFYQPRTKLILPLPGRVLVYEAHDFLAHHRRVDLTHPIVAQLGVTTNPTRFSYDFVPVDKKGDSFRTDGHTNADWFGFGSRIIAPAAGVVVESRNNVDDNILGQKMFDFQRVFQDIKAFYGNYVIIDHRNGEYSALLHLKKGTVSVKPGDKVNQGQLIAQMGISGDSEYVHLHYQLLSGLELNSEPLPSYFNKFRLYRGKKFSLVGTGSMSSGDFVEALERQQK